jgi:rfaE bifunctional protein nucleotidyltransferase chain/domain
MSEVLSLSELSDKVEELKSKGMTVVLCHGVFDILHMGHLKHFEEAKSKGDILVVTVTQDKFVNKGFNRPMFTDSIRARLLSNLSIVDYVAVNEYETAVETIRLVKPNIYVKGIEYKGLDNDAITKEEEAIHSVGGKIVFTGGEVFSSSKIINSMSLPENTVEYLNKFPYSYIDIYDWIKRIEELKVLVVSESILDIYQYGHSIGKSGKSPIVAFELGNKEEYLGGSWAIRNHLSSFVNTVNIVDSSTITKKRYIEGNQKLFETYEYSEHQPFIHNSLDKCIRDYDLVIVADFGHGLLTRNVRDLIKNKAKYLAVATQRNAGNMGHNTIRKYWDRKDNIYICIDEDELRLAVHEKYERDDNLSIIIQNELPKTSIITTGERGCIAYNNTIPSLTSNVIDTVGAGDAFFSITSPLMCVDAPIELVGFIGCVAGAIKVSYSGNKRSVSKKDLLEYSKTLLKR